MKRILSYVGVLLVSVFMFAAFSANVAHAQFAPGDVLINEFKLSGTQWVELFNTTNSDINLSSTSLDFISNSPLEGPSGAGTTTLS